MGDFEPYITEGDNSVSIGFLWHYRNDFERLIRSTTDLYAWFELIVNELLPQKNRLKSHDGKEDKSSLWSIHLCICTLAFDSNPIVV